ncbi:MAG: Outer membrane protein OmpA [uncultured Aureispira sp.]|uniref:Outer membrane protein OmpA n=1 Tax=uncultured Aureispira sp. TaxID=1331704 RepID=A0A6S6TA57_9BACT|nr:MAG: Outer membrane protein OmpA [uncultured Aureispira sp.]
MKNNILFLILGLFIWIFGGLYLYHQCCCTNSTVASNTMTTPTDNLQIKDATYFEASAPGNIKFGDEKADYTLSENVTSAFEQTIAYLNQHPAKVLQIKHPKGDLGAQRGMAIFAYLTTNKAATHQVIVVETEAEASKLAYSFDCLQPFAASTGSTNFSCLDNFVFEQSNFDLAVPLSPELNDLLKKVATQLKENPTTKLDIVAAYLPSEENNSSATNLGKARANKIRSILLEQYAVPPNQIDYKGLVKDDLTFIAHPQFKKELLVGPIDFLFSKQEKGKTAGVDAARLKALEKDLLVSPRRLYFETGKNKIIIDTKFRTYFENVIYYLENVPGASLECSGHTDNRGNDLLNLKLAQERADFTANYFSKQGIASDKIKAISLGEKQPIQSNTTASGRAKNRRVEIIVKKQ